MKRVQLTQGLFTEVDDADFDFVSHWKWRLKRSGDVFYAIRNFRTESGMYTTVRMHVALLSPEKGFEIDHIDGNGLNNQRANLRICTSSQNHMNKGKQKNNTSGFKGVSASHGKFMATITKGAGISRYIGTYDTAEEAAKAYNEAAKIYHGEFARLNQI